MTQEQLVEIHDIYIYIYIYIYIHSTCFYVKAKGQKVQGYKVSGEFQSLCYFPAPQNPELFVHPSLKSQCIKYNGL